ncbi:PaaI family thioesterase [Hyphomicrobium sp.]|uniref:PaaI family thioesterase n=1 Tax=Hyphomicrobium sp. TaxID=82 RepID=UPI0035639754
MKSDGGPISTGLVPSDVAASMSGVDFLAALRDGTLVAPPFSATANIRPLSVERGHVAFEGTPSEQFYNPMGSVHGGWIATLLDTAMACAIQSMLPAGQTYTTLELKTNFVRPVSASTGPLRCDGIVLSFGGRIASSEGKVFDKEGNLVAHGTETCLIMGRRNGTASQAEA